MDNPFQSPAVLSLCPGFLGLERGTERAIGKIRVAAYVEIEAFIIANLIAGMQAGMVDAAPVWTDLKTFDAKPFHKKIHGIMGGYPCQPFSTAGKRKGHEDPRHLWPFIRTIIGTARPVWCWFENVAGHLSMGYDVVYKDLRDLGYSVEAGIYTAEEAGAPHERERLFILAIASDFISHTRRKRMGWQAWTNINWSSSGAELEYPDCQRFIKEGNSERDQQPRSGITSAEMANTNHRSEQHNAGKYAENGRAEGLQKRNEVQEPEQPIDELAHPNSQSRQPIATARLDVEGEILRETRRHENTDGSQSFGETMGYTTSEHERSHTGQDGQIEPGRSGTQQLADTCSTNGEGSGGMASTRRRPELADSNKELAYADCARQPGKRNDGKQDEKNHAGTNNTGTDYWPAGPGQQQYEWEEPRTIEPRLGCAINGYNFREDLLRAYGNSVVEQTTGIAFVDLLKKHFRQ